jgi:hypothetical protein
MFQGILIRAFQKYERRGLKNQFLCWKHSARTRTTNMYEHELFIERNNINELEQLHRNIKRNNRVKAARVIARQNKGYIFNAWVSVNLQLKRINCAKAYAENKIGLLKMRSALGALVKEKTQK